MDDAKRDWLGIDGRDWAVILPGLPRVYERLSHAFEFCSHIGKDALLDEEDKRVVELAGRYPKGWENLPPSFTGEARKIADIQKEIRPPFIGRTPELVRRAETVVKICNLVATVPRRSDGGLRAETVSRWRVAQRAAKVARQECEQARAYLSLAWSAYFERLTLLAELYDAQGKPSEAHEIRGLLEAIMNAMEGAIAAANRAADSAARAQAAAVHARVAAEHVRNEVRETKGLLQRVWDWFMGLTGWPGRKRRKEPEGLAMAREVAGYIGRGMTQEAASREYLEQHGNPTPTDAEVNRVRNRYNEHRKAGNL